MKKGFRGLIAAMAVVAVTSGKSFAQDDKPIGPGWLSLDSSVGVIDNSIANGKGALEKALGISIGGYLDTGWTFSTNHPSNPSYIGLRYFDRDQNKIVFNNFHLVVDKPEKDWGVGFH
ncbi:MAG TPA: hypothetical protein VLA17_13210, partial [Candidatus Limnocylindria bacterium]|nr:hypothetical protein [Candidatus Limnocylindria bacterium]